MVRKKTDKTEDLSEVFPLSVLARLAGASLPILPGESEADYRRGLLETIKEFGASTHLQIYLAEKIFDCVWWVRRLEDQRSVLILNRMVDLLKYVSGDLDVRELLQARVWDSEELLAMIQAAGYSMQSLVAKAMHLEREALRAMDDQTAHHLKALRGFQSAYEALTNRKLIIERLQLQNEGLRRDLSAIDSK